MDKFIKWELKNFFQNKKYWFLGIAVVYLLFIIIPIESDNFLSGLITWLFSIIMFLSILGSFFFGAKTIVNSYKEKTFLLESMIPMPVNKTLLSKYIIGIIINIVFSIVTIAGVLVLFIKGGEIKLLFDLIKALVKEIDIITILRLGILYILSTIFFLSFVVLGFITVKVINPNGKGSKILGFIGWFIILYTYGFIMGSINEIAFNSDYITDLVCLVLSVISFFTTSWLIENKLEIYN